MFDQSVFHPQGGGQPSDIGKITSSTTGAEISVEMVSFDPVSKVVNHRGKLCAAFASTPAEAFRVGDQCDLVVNEEVRITNSECHTVGHMVDAAMLRCGYEFPPLKGYHFQDGPYVEYRGKVEPEKRDPLVEQLQEKFQELVSEDIITTISMMPVRDAEARLKQKQKNVDFSHLTDPEVRIVGIAGYEGPCGG
jgi:Ser-tRNA(Ala) deacylase AlaX